MLDKNHKYDIYTQEDFTSTIFQIEYTKQAQAQIALQCSKDCFQTWRIEDLNKNEKECLLSCFSRSNALYDQFYSRTVKFNETLMSKKMN